MTTWGYAYLYRIRIYESRDLGGRRIPNFSSPLSDLFAIEDAEGLRVIQDIQGMLAALNYVGRSGWIVQVPAAWEISNVNAGARDFDTDHIRELINRSSHDAVGAAVEIHIMRRSENLP